MGEGVVKAMHPPPTPAKGRGARRAKRPEPTARFSVTLYGARVGAAQGLGRAGRRLMDWCAGIAMRDGTVCFALNYPELLAFCGCSYSTMRRALDEVIAKGWLVEAHWNGRNWVCKLGAMYGLDARGHTSQAVRLVEKVFGVRLGEQSREALAGAIASDEESLKRLAQVCKAARRERANFHDVDGLIRRWRTAVVFGHVAGPEPVETAGEDGMRELR